MFRHLRANRAGPDGKHTDAMGPYFRCNRLSESDKRGLAGGVAREICNWDGAARDVDNPALAARNHSGQNSPGTEHAATQIDIQCSPPLLYVRFPEGTNRPGNGCVVDQHGDGAERTFDFLQRLSNGRCIRYVGSKGPRPASRLLDRAGRFFDFRSGTCENRRCPASSELVGVALELIGITGLGSALQSMDSHLPLYRGDKLF